MRARSQLGGLGVALGVTLALAMQTQPGFAQEVQAKRGKTGWLGIGLECDNCSIREENGVRVWRFSSPPRVTRVLDASPAERAGIEEGDLLVSIDGQSLTAAEGGERFGMLTPGTPIALGVRRDGRELLIQVAPGERPRQDVPDLAWLHEYQSLQGRLQAYVDSLHQRQGPFRVRLDSLRAHLDSMRLRLEALRLGELAQQQRLLKVYVDSMRPKLDSLAVYVLPRVRPDAYAFGFRYDEEAGGFVGPSAVAGAQMITLGDDLRDYFPGAAGGVLVLRVVEGTPAEGGGLKPGDVILLAGGKSVGDVSDVRRAFRAARQPVQLEVVRKGKKVRLTIP